jgi:outer membrane protein TolC
MKNPILALSSLLTLGTLAWAANGAKPSPTPHPSPTPKAVSKAQPAKKQEPGTPADKPQEPGSKKWDLTLDEAVNLALRQNPDVLHAKQEIERTRGVVIEVRAQALPQATVTSAYTQQDINLLRDSAGAASGGSQSSSKNSGGGQPATTGSTKAQSQSQSQASPFTPQTKAWNVTLTGKQLLYAGGSVSAALKIAHSTEASSYYSLRETIDTVIARTRTFFCQVLVNRELIKVQEESVRLLRDQLKDQQIRFEAGTVPRFNVLQAEVALSNAIPNLINAKNAYLISQLNLAKVLGVDYGGATAPVPFNAVGNLDIEERPITLEQATEIARAQRSIMKVRREAILIQVEQIKVALAGYKPTLAVQGGYEVRNSRASNSLADTVNGWFFGVTGSWDVFDGFATYGKAKQARAALEEARIDYNDTWHFVELEVQQAYANIQQAKELLASQEKNVEQAEEAVRLATERLAAGAGTQLDVLSQTVALTTAQTTRLQARSQYIQALADYDRATGYVTRYEETFKDPVVEKLRQKLQGEMPLGKPGK